MIQLEQNERQSSLTSDQGSASFARPTSHDRLFNTLQGIAMLCFLWAAFATLLIAIVAIQMESRNGNRDFITYWSAGQMLVHGHNPYDADLTLTLERSVGFTNPIVAIVSNPPVILPLVAPLGFFNASVATGIWTAFLVSCFLLSLRAIWSALDRPRGYIYWLGVCFAPILTCVMAGQIGILLLLSVALFLQFHRSRAFMAGVALVPCALKPHLFIPFGIALLLWIISRGQYRFFAGFLVALIALASIATAIDRHAWSQWFQWMRTFNAVNLFQPDLSKMFRLLVRPDAIWLQFVPEIIASVWAAWYFWTRRSKWDWMQQGLLLLIISVGCAPYAWFTDESILLVPLIAGAYRATAANRTLLPCALILAVAVTELFKGNWIGTTYYLWTIPAYLLWYIYATRQSRGSAYLAPVSEAHV
jgi:hypothetical protein